ncbi:hypothetical protein WP3W18E01_24720 [Raoultella ornithinolytica]|nr:hypothetical protein WP3W18E01_24720 [Raoultella ornithinolytica]STR71931.1 Uncharacterised protein [Raoultella ornithinolytica]SXF36837.1 Uncharacterised protein [Klebsiella variicola]
MKIHSAVFHPNGCFIDALNQSDFWVLLSRTLGWAGSNWCANLMNLPQMEEFLN